MVTALQRLREHYEFERRGFIVRELAGGFTLAPIPMSSPPPGGCWPSRARRR